MAQAPYVQPPSVPQGTRFNAPQTPAGWIWDNIKAWFVPSDIAGTMRGSPAPMGADQRYQSVPPVKQPRPDGNWTFTLTRRYDRGAYAYGVRGGVLAYDPIGPGILTTRPMDPTAPAAFKIPTGNAIFWNPQGINWGITPASGAPIYTPEQLASIFANPALAGGPPGTTATQLIAPAEGGFGS